MRILLIRHGEKEGHGFDVEMTNKGRYQIERLAKEIKKRIPRKIYSSTNPRSIESGKIIARELMSENNVLEGLKELKRETFFSKSEDMEDSEAKIIDNAKRLLNDLIKKEEDVILVMNAGLNRLIICELLDIPLAVAGKFTQDFASVSELELKEIRGERMWCLNSINQTYA